VTRRTGSAEQINEMYGRLHRETKSIIDSSIQLAYFMRGAMKYNDILYSMSYVERDMASEFINKRLEQESKNPHPTY
jgi:hypothetical protein